jgi:hypothetical protein
MIRPTTTINKTTLKAASALLHDARFYAEDLIFESEKHEFRIKCWVLSYLKRSERSRRRPWDAWVLTVFNVKSCKVDLHERVIDYELADLSFHEEPKVLELVTHYAISIVLTVADLSGSLVATGESKEF